MESNFNSESIKGDRSMTQGFVAQYAAEAALRIDGVVSLVPSFAVALKEKAGVVHEGKGIRVVFDENDDNTVSITCYPVISYGKIIRKDINTTDGLLPASFDTYQIVEEGNIVMRLTDLQNDHKSLRVGLVKEEKSVQAVIDDLVESAADALRRLSRITA